MSIANTANLVAYETVPDERMGDVNPAPSILDQDLFDVDFKKMLEEMVVDKGSHKPCKWGGNSHQLKEGWELEMRSSCGGLCCGKYDCKEDKS